MNRAVSTTLATVTLGGVPVLLTAPLAHAQSGDGRHIGRASPGAEHRQPAATPIIAGVAGLERGSVTAAKHTADVPAPVTWSTHPIAARAVAIVVEPWEGTRARAPPR
jgi:hypothetical protein